MSNKQMFEVSLRLKDNYLFEIDFAQFGVILADEPEPLGNGQGPNPSQLLAASVANCLAASLIFAIRKYKGEPGKLSATISGETVRDNNNRLRINHLVAKLYLHNNTELMPHLDKALAQFENFCTITQSVRSGIDVDVTVFDVLGNKIYPIS